MELDYAIHILNQELLESEYKKTNNIFFTAIDKVLSELEKLKKSNKPNKAKKIIFDNDLKK